MKHLPLILLLQVFIAWNSEIQAHNLIDDFDRTNQVGAGGGWWPWVSDGTVNVKNNQLEIREKVVSAENAVFETVSYPGCNISLYETRTWFCNMYFGAQQPTGVGPSKEGAFMGIMGYTNNGNGYAAILGQNASGSTAVELVRYSGGLFTGTQVTLLSVPVTAASYMSVRVDYDPVLARFYLSVNENALAFPPFPGGAADAGPVVDQTYQFGNGGVISLGVSSNGVAPERVALFDNVYGPGCSGSVPPLLDVSFLGPNLDILEGSTGNTVTIGLDQPAQMQRNLQVLIESDGVAGYGTGGDFVSSPPAQDDRYVSLTFMPGQQTASFDLNTTNNLVFEPIERLKLTLVDIPADWSASVTNKIVSIHDDDNLPELEARVILDGPFDDSSGLMNDGLRASGVIPLEEPFTELGFLNVSPDYTLIDPAVLSVTGNDAIVDWVKLEARSSTNPVEVIWGRAALLQRDGDIVDLDGVSDVDMPLQFGAYYFSVQHRNHFGVMSASPILLHPVLTSFDFSDASANCWGVNARKNVNGTMTFWSGDVNKDGEIKYIGQDNDRDPILIDVGGSAPTNTVNGYLASDVNLDGVVKYIGQSNDRDPVLQNVGGAIVTNVLSEQMP